MRDWESRGVQGTGAVTPQAVSIPGPGKRTLTEQLTVQPVQAKAAVGTTAGEAGAASGEAASPAWKPEGEPPRVEQFPHDVLVALQDAAEAVEGSGATEANAKAPTPPADVPGAGGKADDKDTGGAAAATGIATTISVDRFVGEAKKVQSKWGELTAEQRAGGLGKAANAELASANVPATDSRLADGMGVKGGQFAFQDWTLEMSKPNFSVATIDDEKSASLASQIYHEARHAEQWHRMARLLAGKGKTAGQIVTETQIKADVAADAVKKPIAAGGAEAKEADSFYQSAYGTGKAHREATLKELFKTGDANTKAQQAYDASAKDPTATAETKAAALKKWQDAYTAFTAAVTVYKALPEEADAYKTGGAVESKYKAKP